MPDVFTDSSPAITTKGSNIVKPVREATPLLIGKIIFALLLPIILYIIVLTTSLQMANLFNFTGDWNFGFLSFLLIMTGIQAGLVLLIVLQWKNHEYYLTENYIQENRGFLTRTSKKYEMRDVRDVSVRQGILGRLWNFGDVIIDSSAPEYHEVIILTAIPEPYEHERLLERFVSVN